MLSASKQQIAIQRSKALIAEQCRESLGFYSMRALGFNNADHHYEWYDFLENKAYTDDKGNILYYPIGHKDPYNSQIAIMAPRSHAKSTVFTVNYPTWRIGKNPNIRIIIVGSAATQSQSFLREIKGHLEQNTKYHELFGNLSPGGDKNPVKWTDSEIIVKRSNHKLKDPTVTAVGAGGTILSKRADVIICDDILSPDNTRTFEQRQKLREWFYQVLLPCLEPNGQLIVVGTAWNQDDLLHELMERPNYQVRKVYKAVKNMETHEVMWPERWSFDKLMALKDEMGSLAFNKAYQNEANSAEDAVFQQEWIHEAKQRGKNRRLFNLSQKFDYSTWDLGEMVAANGIDLAISQKRESDNTAMFVTGKTLEGMRIPLYVCREKMTPAQTRQRILDIHDSFSAVVRMHKVETNGYQESLRRDLVETTDLPITGHSTGSEKFDLDMGINSMAVDFENGKWIIPWDKDDPNTIAMMSFFCDGLLAFPNGHTEDVVMAAWLSNMALRDLTVSRDTGDMEVAGGGLYRGVGRNNLGLYG